MNYCVLECDVAEGTGRTAGVKARDDAEEIFNSLKFKTIAIPATKITRVNLGILQKMNIHREIKNKWRKALSGLQPGDTLLIQFPNREHSIFLPAIIKQYVKKGVKVVLLIHDLEMIRTQNRKDVSLLLRIRILLEEKRELNCAHKIIVHNQEMLKLLKKMGIPEKKMVDLQIFDYLIPDCDLERLAGRKIDRSQPIIVAGNLKRKKTGYVYQLNGKVPYNLYGIGYDGESTDTIKYLGSREPNDLPYEMNGSFGLVWDGPDSTSCTGAYGEYLRINNPHKTSLYLASGIPVIIWKEAALAGFVMKNKCGFAVNSLDEIEKILAELSDEEYLVFRTNAERIAEKLRVGEYTRNALKRCGVID